MSNIKFVSNFQN